MSGTGSAAMEASIAIFIEEGEKILIAKEKQKPQNERIHEIVREAVEIEKSFIIDALPCSLIGMNSQKMSEYIEFVSDRLLKQIGVPIIYNSKNPFDFMENLSLDGKTNFFEKRVGDYGKLGSTTSLNEVDKIDFNDDDF